MHSLSLDERLPIAYESLPVTTALPNVTASDYPVPAQPDVFSADADYVKSRVADGRTVIASTCDVAFRKRLSGWKS
jgi:hypothetical protein